MSEIIEVVFKVAMDDEQKKLKNFTDVTLKVDMEDASFEELYKYAIRSYRIELQGQIRSNWDMFVKGDYPKELKFGQGMFATRARTMKVKMTPEEMKASLQESMKGMTQEQKMAYLMEKGYI
jgi:hypothetical protein